MEFSACNKADWCSIALIDEEMQVLGVALSAHYKRLQEETLIVVQRRLRIVPVLEQRAGQSLP